MMSEEKFSSIVSTSRKVGRFYCSAVVLTLLAVLSVGLLLDQGASAEDLRLPGIDELNRQADAELRLPGVDELDDGLDLLSICEIMGDCGSSGSGYGYPYSGYP
jgi:hypothetical protein